MLCKQIDTDIDTGHYIVTCTFLNRYCNVMGAMCTASSK